MKVPLYSQMSKILAPAVGLMLVLGVSSFSSAGKVWSVGIFNDQILSVTKKGAKKWGAWAWNRGRAWDFFFSRDFAIEKKWGNNIKKSDGLDLLR